MTISCKLISAQRYHFIHPRPEHHAIDVEFNQILGGFGVKAIYKSGSLFFLRGAVIADWGVLYDRPIPEVDAGCVQIGLGRIDVEFQELRGIGMGSLLMSILIVDIKSLEDVPVAPITLSADDASTPEAKVRRNRFYEKFGFSFDYKDNFKWGESKPISSHSLKVPELKATRGWVVLEESM